MKQIYSLVAVLALSTSLAHANDQTAARAAYAVDAMDDALFGGAEATLSFEGTTPKGLPCSGAIYGSKKPIFHAFGVQLQAGDKYAQAILGCRGDNHVRDLIVSPQEIQFRQFTILGASNKATILLNPDHTVRQVRIKPEPEYIWEFIYRKTRVCNVTHTTLISTDSE